MRDVEMVMRASNVLSCPLDMVLLDGKSWQKGVRVNPFDHLVRRRPSHNYHSKAAEYFGRAGL